jgi:hypothetical protein
MKLILTIGLSAALTLTCAAIDSKGAKSALTGIPAPELPVKAATLVKNVKPRDLQATTTIVVKEAVSINPAAAPAIVGAVARSVPEAAPQAAATAASEQPAQAAAIARAAAAAAPTQAGRIVAAVCRAVPNSYREVAVAVAKAVPGSGKDVLTAVASVLPQHKAAIEKALASYNGNTSVASVLDTTAPAIARGPAVGPPYVPVSGTPVNATPGSSTDVPPGGRDYTGP